VTYQFVVERHPSGEFRGTHARDEMLARALRFAEQGWLFNLRTRGTDWSRPFTRGEALERVKSRTAARDDDFKLFLKRRRDKAILSIHKIEVEPPVADLGCHPEVEKIHAALVHEFGSGGISSGGRYYCRYVDGTRTVSRHGYVDTGWKGAAEDIFASPDSMGELAQRANFIISKTKAGVLRADRVIVGASSWRPIEGWTTYTGAYHRHVHYECNGGRPCL
jgi:hypothetical protein